MGRNSKTWFVYLFMFLFLSGILQAQEVDFTQIDTLITNGKNFAALQKINTYDTLRIKKNDLALLHLYKAKCFAAENQNAKAFLTYLQAKRDYFSIDSIDKAMDINLEIAFLLSTEKNNRKKAETYIEDYLKYALKKKDDLIIAKAYFNWGTLIMEEQPEKSVDLFRKSLRYSELTKNDEQFEKLYSNLGVLYNEILQKQDSAIYFIDKSIVYSTKINNQYGICISLINKASCYYGKKDYHRALTLLTKANEIPLLKNEKIIKSYIYQFLALNYNELGDFKNAYENLSNYVNVQEEFNFDEQNKKISEFNIQYQTKEKEIENLTLKAKVQRNQIITYTTLGILLVAVILAVLIYKNISKKRKIAEQAQMIQAQKLEKTLRDRELHDIDLMLKSQEVERQQIANELHDNLGSLLATLKLNFQNINRSHDAGEQKLFEKTDALLEETYQKVRNISHLKNMGVVGNEGLLVSVKKMAEKMTVINRLDFNVIPFGLTQRLSNSVEVTLFRIIQELCTNIIKHSKATEVSIYLTQHNLDLINIIIEDNGKGFDYRLVTKKDGIGLKNIEHKVEQMGGTFTVDSIISKGTTIIIDLPL